MKSRQAKSGNRLPPILVTPDRRRMEAPAVTGPELEGLALPLLVLVDTVELVPALAPVVGLDELVPDPDPDPDEPVAEADSEPDEVADGVELGDCPELADVAEVAVALEPLDSELPEVGVAELDAAVEESVPDVGADVDEPLALALALLLALDDASVVEEASVVDDA